VKRAGSLIFAAAALLLGACGSSRGGDTPVYGYQVVHVYPHDPQAFTQGLFYQNGFLYEGTGLKGRSSVRKVDLETGKVLEQNDVPDAFFGEGIAPWQGRIVELTWTSGTAFVYQIAGLQMQSTFHYAGEGWGLTTDGKEFILSDGTAVLKKMDPATFTETGSITVTDQGEPVTQLNELEWVKGEIYANVWQTDRIARISPSDGHVTGWIDLSGLLGGTGGEQVDVLNGIAYDAQHGRLFVTGKLWPKLFEIRLVRR
jgi:glutamine cyclotransferase